MNSSWTNWIRPVVYVVVIFALMATFSMMMESHAATRKAKTTYTVTYYAGGNVPIKVYTNAGNLYSQSDGVVEFQHEGKTIVLRGNVEIIKENVP